MSALSFKQLYDGAGNPYKNRDNILIERIANKQLLKLDKDKGYIKVFDIKVVFQDGTESSYNWKDLKDEKKVRALKMDMNSAANQKSRKAKLLLTGSKSDHDDSLLATVNISALEKTEHFGGSPGGGNNKGNEYEDYLAESFRKFQDHGGRYPDDVTEILKAICGANPGTCYIRSKQEGGENKPRPMKYDSSFYISAEGRKTEEIGPTVTDITVWIADPEGKKEEPIYLSVKFGDTLSFFNIGVKGGRKDSLKIFPTDELKDGKLTEMGEVFLDMFNINHGKFIETFQKYDKDDKTPTVADHQESYQIEGQAKRNLQKFIKSGVGKGYWMVHRDKSGLHVYNINDAYLTSASTLKSDNINVDYGGKGGYAKRVNIEFSTKEYDFSVNLRSKSSSDNYPGYANGDYKKN